MLFIDLDHFKTINDSLGHDTGDLLIEVARRIRSSVRNEDTVTRQGGDEFIVLLPEIDDVQSAGTLGQKLLEALVVPYSVQGRALHISASVGIAVFPDDGTDVDTLLKNSDIAMYQAKANGRNNCQFFTFEMNRLAAERHAMDSELRHALAEGVKTAAQLAFLAQRRCDLCQGNYFSEPMPAAKVADRLERRAV